MNIRNLLRLAYYLENNVSQHQFDMREYRAESDGSRAYFIEPNNCGTIGCALGHAPFVHHDMRPIEDDMVKHEKPILRWHKYSKRVFDIFPGGDNWFFMFDADWQFTDNSVEGAVARLRYHASNRTHTLNMSDESVETYMKWHDENYPRSNSTGEQV